MVDLPLDETGYYRTKKKNMFFLDGVLHQALYTNRSAGTVLCFRYENNVPSRVIYPYADVRRRRQQAFTTGDVALMMNRKRMTLAHAIGLGNISMPQTTPVKRNAAPYNYCRDRYWWGEKEILELHAFFLTRIKNHVSKRQDLPSRKPIPSRAELLAMIRNDPLTYVKSKDGGFIPIWKEKNY